MEIVPVNFGIKYRPAKLGIQYHMPNDPNAHFVHEIPLDFIEAGSNIDEVGNTLFKEHSQYLNAKVVSQNQILRLLKKLQTNLIQNAADKENMAPATQVTDYKKDAQSLMESGRQSEKSAASQGNSALMISDIAGTGALEGLQQVNQEEEDMDNLLKTGAFTREMLGQELAGEEEAEEEQQQVEGEEEEVIDIDNPEELAKRGLRRIQIEGEDEEYLMDAENNIYDLAGNFIGTTDGDQQE